MPDTERSTQSGPAHLAPLLALFRHIVRRYFRRHFHGVRLSGTHHLAFVSGPLIVYANHSSWWDPMVAYLLARKLFPDRRHYAPMDASALKRYPVLRQLGIFPVEMQHPPRSRQFLRTGQAILRSGGVLWVTPQGQFADPRERPLVFKPGLAALAARMGRMHPPPARHRVHLLGRAPPRSPPPLRRAHPRLRAEQLAATHRPRATARSTALDAAMSALERNAPSPAEPRLAFAQPLSFNASRCTAASTPSAQRLRWHFAPPTPIPGGAHAPTGDPNGRPLPAIIAHDRHSLHAFALAVMLCALSPGGALLRQPPPLPARRRPRTAPLPPISVLIPARNEERSIRAAVESVLASTGVDFELIVLDDASTDRTAEIVTELIPDSSGRLRLAHAPPLPPGWNGKQHACWSLAHLARYDTLCFIDADVRLAPDALARMSAFSTAGPAKLVSGFPRQITDTWLEWLLLPLIHFVLLGFLPVSAMRKGTDPSFAAGCGQFLMVDRPAYFAAGGHAAIRETMHDGLRLPRLFRQHGFRTDLADLTHLADCRMYTDAAEVWQGLAKNATEGIAAPARILPISILSSLGEVAPFLLAASSRSSTGTPHPRSSPMSSPPSPEPGSPACSPPGASASRSAAPSSTPSASSSCSPSSGTPSPANPSAAPSAGNSAPTPASNPASSQSSVTFKLLLRCSRWLVVPAAHRRATIAACLCLISCEVRTPLGP